MTKENTTATAKNNTCLFPWRPITVSISKLSRWEVAIFKAACLSMFDYLQIYNVPKYDRYVINIM